MVATGQRSAVRAAEAQGGTDGGTETRKSHAMIILEWLCILCIRIYVYIYIYTDIDTIVYRYKSMYS